MWMKKMKQDKEDEMATQKSHIHLEDEEDEIWKKKMKTIRFHVVSWKRVEKMPDDVSSKLSTRS